MTKNHFTSVSLGFEGKLWEAANKLRSNLDPSDYRSVVLGLIFLKYISDTFRGSSEDKKHISGTVSGFESINKEYSQNTFKLPPEAYWNYLAKNIHEEEIVKLVDIAMEAIELNNPSLKGVLVKGFSKKGLEKERLRELITLIGTIELEKVKIGSQDILGRVFEYFLGQFAELEGKKGGQFYTPPSVVKLLIEMTKPFKGKVLDPCCGSGGIFIQSERFIEFHGGNFDDISVFGQESNRSTWSLCKMNLFIHRIVGNIEWGDSLTNDLHEELRADFILANPPFNVKEWQGEKLRQDQRWKYGVPPIRNANYAWIQHFIHHLGSKGIAGFILTNGSLSTTTTKEGNIRKNIVKDNLIDCIVTLPDKLFYNTGIPACLWIINKDKTRNKYKKEILFIDARSLGFLTDRIHRELSQEVIKRIATIYNNWKTGEGDYEDILGFCKSVTTNQVQDQNYILTPARYIGVQEYFEEDESFKAKMDRLTSELAEQFEESNKLIDTINRSLGDLDFDF